MQKLSDTVQNIYFALQVKINVFHILTVSNYQVYSTD